MEPTVIFGAVTNIETEPEGTVQFQINPDALSTAYDAGTMLHHLMTHLAQALAETDRAPDYFTALTEMQRGVGDALNDMLEQAQAAQNGGH
ncbi:MAG: hypothetical protein ACRBB0_07280 [Pelagimonas sp.]|uniref:hypothetical protein n=1 Tax=Pelagimonas sp. TaxID=2073170 RepID=UPI003D6AA3C7